jgi:hypothetical protein
VTDLQRATEILIVIQLTVIGASHIAYHRAWAEFIIWLRAKGETGAFHNGFLSLATGSLILGFHRVWSGIPLVLTVFGILNLAKAASCFLLPAAALRSMHRVALDRSREFVYAGALSLGLAGLVAFHLLGSA